jgi:hypothetical protein
MSLYDRYLMTLALIFIVTTLLLAVYGQYQLDLYFALYIIENLAATLIFSYLHPRARLHLRLLGLVLIGGFLVIVALKVLEIPLGSGSWI